MIDVVIPLLDRPSVRACVDSLMKAPEIVRRIFLVDATMGIPTTAGQIARMNPNIELVHCPSEQFNRGALLNEGIASCCAPYVLCSDADIIWNTPTLDELQTLAEQLDGFATVACVDEDSPATQTVGRRRYDYSVSAESRQLSIHEVRVDPLQRAGPGLACAPLGVWKTVGGFYSHFRGWGWEDQDLLSRAELLGFRRGSIGKVVHLSHPDSLRNRASKLSPAVSRDLNILTSVARIRKGELVGSAFGGSRRLPLLPVSVKLPPELESLRDTVAAGVPAESSSD